jgi:hypothetical protein
MAFSAGRQRKLAFLYGKARVSSLPYIFWLF